MIVTVVLGVAIGLALGSLGGGGSILAVPVLAHIAGQSASVATATSLVAVGVAAALASVGHARSGSVRWGAAAAFIVTGIPAAWAGAETNGRLDGDVLLLAFSGLVLVAAHRMLTACPSCTNVGEKLATATADAPEGRDASTSTSGSATGGTTLTRAPTTSRSFGSIAKIVVAGSVVGFLTGLFGVGGGFVIVPALTLVLGLSMPVAIGTSLLVVLGNASVALAFRGLDAVDWQIALPFTATMIVGSTIGALVAHRLPPVRSLQAFAVLLVLVAIGNAVAAGLALA